MRFLIDRVIEEEGLYVYYMHNVVGKHLSINIAKPGRETRVISGGNG
jgi:hypothetical protein